MLPISARWIQEFEKHLYRRQHIILYSNIHDQFLWQGTYQDMAGFLNTYFLNSGFDLIVRYDPVDGLTFPQSEMRQLFDELVRQRQTEQQQERLGQLTNRILERPYSILLFDEIEKAHAKVLDKFLQILEDGRLTDGKGQTVYFNQTVIIFTSNIGASDLSDPQTGAIIRTGIMTEVQRQGIASFSYAQVEAHFRSEVHWHFTSRIGRAELLNRLGDSIVVFDLLRPEFVWQIGEKFLRQLAESAWDKYRLLLLFQTSVLEVLSVHMQEADNLLFGSRRIKTLLETLVERPLNRWIFENYPDLNILAGRRLIVGLGNNSVLSVVEG